MSELSRLMDRRSFVAGATVLGAATLLSPGRAWADDEEAPAEDAPAQEGPTYDEKRAEADAVAKRLGDLQKQLTIQAEDYYKALDAHETAVKAVNDAQKRLDDADTKITDVQSRIATRMRSMYRDGRPTLLDLAMDSTTFQEFATSWDLLDDLNKEDSELVQETKDLRDQIASDKEELDKQEQAARDAADEAARIKKEGEEQFKTLTEELQKLDEEARQLFEQEQDRLRAEGAAAAADGVRRNYAYYIPTRDIPSQGTVVDYALSRIGCPYVWGAEGPDEFDCSGLVRWAYLQVGMSVPHQTESLYYAAAARLPVYEAMPGDVLWISFGDGYNGHVGIACNPGGTHYVHAPTFGAYVRDTDDLSWAGFTHALRFA